MVTDEQVRRLFSMKNRYQHLHQAGDAAGMSPKTGYRYVQSGKAAVVSIQQFFTGGSEIGRIKKIRQRIGPDIIN